MNARAYGLAIRLRDDLASLRGAASISLHAQKAWALFLIMAGSDQAVISLSEALGLRLDIRRAKSWWRRIAIGEREGGAIRCEICGPHHWERPPDIRAEHSDRTATAPVTATQVLELARGAPAFPTVTGERLILLVSLGLDLRRDDVRAALLELHQRGELRLVNLSNPSFVRTDLGPQGLRFELADESAFREGVICHAVVLA